MSTPRALLEHALALHRAGRLDEAEPIYRQVLAAEPGNPYALHLLGVALHQRGQHALAVDLIGRAVAGDPKQAPFYLNLASAQAASGDLEGAVASMRSAIRLDPRNAQARHDLGVMLAALRRSGDAASEFETAIALDPTFAEAQLSLAKLHRERQMRHEAIAVYRGLLAQQPACMAAMIELAATLRDVGQLDEAADYCRRAIAADPQSAQAHNLLGVIHHDQNRPSDAIFCHRTAIRLCPEMAAAHSALGVALFTAAYDDVDDLTLEKYDPAIASFREAIRLDPDYADAHHGLGVALHQCRRPLEAVAAYERSLALRPDDADAHGNLGQLLVELGEFARGGAHLDRALEIDPNSPVRTNRGALSLLQGDFAAGWPGLEARWQTPIASPRPGAGPEWRGEPLAGRTILIYPEQGFGDAMQFIRYASLLKDRGARVLVGAQQRMIPILSTCPGIDGFISEFPPPPHDVQAGILSLPGIFGTELHTIPANVPYLFAPADLVEHWRQKLSGETALRVGINWQGRPTYRGDFYRSIPLVEFAPLAAVQGVRLFSLQQGHGREQLAAARFAVEDLGVQLNETHAAFCETAAVIRNLDLVVTSDTALAHLAGALGAPVWLAVSYSPDWRWLLDREDSPWYPTMRLFRQTTFGDWRGVFARMAAELAALVARRRHAS